MSVREERHRSAVLGALRRLYMAPGIHREYGVYAIENFNVLLHGGRWHERLKSFIKRRAGEELLYIKHGPRGCLPSR